MRIDLVGTTADFRRFRPPRPLRVNHLLRKDSAAAGRIGEVRLGGALRPVRGAVMSEQEQVCAVAIMAKASVAGAVKTRLVPPLTPEEAAELNTCCLADVAANIAAAARQAPIQ